jgi:hypothetical protein
VTSGDPVDLGTSLTTPGFFLRSAYCEVLQRFRRQAPVHRTADGLLAISRYEDIRAICRDPVRFMSGRGVLVTTRCGTPRERDGTRGQFSTSTRPCMPPTGLWSNGSPRRGQCPG